MNTRHITAITLAASIGFFVGPSHAQDTAPCGKQWTVVDTNNDLAVSPEEAEASRDMDYSRLDQDGDGEISQDEWAACNDMSMVGQGAASDGLMMPDAGTGDADQSGGLSRAEMAEAMQQKFAEAGDAEREEAQARYTGAWFALHDENGDGEISPQEVAEVDLERASSQAFERADENDDGVISKDEYDRTMTTRFEAAQETASGGLPVALWQYYVVVD